MDKPSRTQPHAAPGARDDAPPLREAITRHLVYTVGKDAAAASRRPVSMKTAEFSSRTSARSRSMLQKRTSALVPSPASASWRPICAISDTGRKAAIARMVSSGSRPG